MKGSLGSKPTISIILKKLKTEIKEQRGKNHTCVQLKSDKEKPSCLAPRICSFFFSSFFPSEKRPLLLK